MLDNKDEIDRLLDSALADYAEPGPDSELEGRILSRLSSEATPSPHRHWLPWVIALPVLASLLLFVVLSRPWPNHPSVTAPQHAHVLQAPSPASEAANRPPSRTAPAAHNKEAPLHKLRPRHAALASKSTPLPKLEIFPSPQPLSPEEQALANFAVHATPSERESLIAAQRQADAPLHIAAIHIEPLEPPTAGAN